MKLRLRFVIVKVPGHLPLEADGSTFIDVEDGTSVARALDSLSLPSGENYLTLVNEESIPGADRPSRILQEGDVLTIFSALKGG